MEINYLDESHLLLFLLQILILLTCARGLGELFRRIKQPAITAEILVGIVLGPTILARVAPPFYEFLFPQDIIQINMLETIAWVGLLFFLLNTGLEIDFSSAWRQKGDALKISLTDLIIPMVITFIPCLFLPEHYMGALGQRLIFAFFLAVVMTISALPVTARVLNDLRLYKTDMGFLIMSALTVNDLLGWVVFTLILGFFTDTDVRPIDIFAIIGFTIGFTAFCLTIGRSFTNKIISKFKQKKFPEPSTSLTFMCLMGILCGAITLKIGIHALFGFFIAGIMVGEAKALPEKSRQVISQMVHALFIPLFFVSVGLKVDFLNNFDPFLAAFIFILGTIARFVGAWIGVTFTGRHKANRMIISLAHIPGGEMQIVIGMLAIEYKLITEPVFVAIVFGAVLTSIILGPLMALSLKMRKSVNPLDYFLRRAMISDIDPIDKNSAIRFLSQVLSEEEDMPDKEGIYETVIKRENEMGTALENGVAIPHAQIRGISSPFIVFARSIKGINWDSPDGKLTHFIFLIIVPEKDSAIHLKICQAIAKTMSNANIGKSLMDAKDNKDILDIFTAAFRDLENS